MKVGAYAIPGIVIAADKDFILKTVANFYNIPEQSIKEKTRKREVVYARHATMALMMKAGYSTPNIALFLKRDHATVLYGQYMVKVRRETESEFRKEYDKLKRFLKL